LAKNFEEDKNCEIKVSKFAGDGFYKRTICRVFPCTKSYCTTMRASTPMCERPSFSKANKKGSLIHGKIRYIALKAQYRHPFKNISGRNCSNMLFLVSTYNLANVG